MFTMTLVAVKVLTNRARIAHVAERCHLLDTEIDVGACN